jgi:hypothetical protein
MPCLTYFDRHLLLKLVVVTHGQMDRAHTASSDLPDYAPGAGPAAGQIRNARAASFAMATEMI